MKRLSLRFLLCVMILCLVMTTCSSPKPQPVPTPALPLGSLSAGQPQPATTEEITFQSGSFTLVGDLWLPEGTGPFPVVLLNQGSGMDARPNRGYSPMLDRMLQAGYAVFSWDKPGVGKSTGQLSDVRVLHERAQVLLDAIEVMKAHPDIDPQRIGLEGGSQAGYVMSLVLSTSQEIAFMICDSCPGMSGVDQTTYQYMAMALCAGTPESQADRRAELLAELDAARTYETYGQYAHYREVVQALFSTASNVPKGYGFEVVPEEAWRLNDPEKETWWDPMGVIRHTTIPVLVLLGDQDRRMDPLQAAHAWREALEVAGNPNSRVELFANANHDLVVSETGCPDDDVRWLDEYAKARGYESLAAAMAAAQENPELMNQFPFAPGYLDTIEAWLRDLRQ